MIKINSRKKRGVTKLATRVIIAVVFFLGLLGLQGKASAVTSMTTISGPSSFDTPSLLASLVYTNMGNNTVQESLQVSSFGNYPSDDDVDKANQSYGSLTAPSSKKKTSLTQGRALQSYIYTLDALGLEGKLYSQGENPPDVAVNGDSYAVSNAELFPKKNEKVKVLWHKTKVNTWEGTWESIVFSFFNGMGSFFAGFCDIANKLIDSFIDIYSSIPKLFSDGAKGKGFLFDILNGIAGLFGVSSFFTWVRQIIAPYALGGVIISIGVASFYLLKPRPEYRNVLASVWHILFRVVLFTSGFALLGWSYTNLIVPFQNEFKDMTTEASSLNDAKSQSIDALAWGISTNFSLDPSVTGVSLDQTQLESGKVQSALIDNPTVISNINQKSIDILGKDTLSAIASPLQYSGEVTKSDSPYKDEWNQAMNQSSSGTFSYEDYLNGMATAMKSNKAIEAMNNPLTSTANQQLTAGGYFGDGNYYYGSKYGVNNFNTSTYLFIANPKNGYEGSTSTDDESSPAGEGSGTMSVKLSNPADGGESLEIKNLSKNKPFWAIPVEVTNFESYLFGAVPAQSMTTQTSSTFTGLSQDMQFADIAEMNKQGTYLTQDSQGNISGITNTKDKHIRNNAYQVVLMNKEAGVDPATASNSNYFQFSTQSALFFLNSQMTSSGALNFSFPNGINFTGSQGNSTKQAYFNRMISISAGGQASNVVLNSFKFMVYGLIYICIAVALLNTALLKKMIENVLSYASFLGSGHLVDFVAGTTMAIAFIFLKISARLGIAVGSIFYTAVDRTLMNLTKTDTSSVTMVALWGATSAFLTAVLLFIPVVPNAHGLLNGNPTREAKRFSKAFKSGKKMAETSGSVGAVAVAGVLGFFATIGNRMAKSVPAVIVILPLIIQKNLMEKLASPLVAVQDGSFIGKRGGYGVKAKSVTQEKINKKISTAKGGQYGLEELANKLDPTVKNDEKGYNNNLENVGQGVGGKRGNNQGTDKEKTEEKNKKGKKGDKNPNKHKGTDGVGKDDGIGKKKGNKQDGKDNKNQQDDPSGLKDKENLEDELPNTDKLVDPKTGEKVDPEDWDTKEELLKDKYMKNGASWANAKNQAKKDIENEKARKKYKEEKEKSEQEAKQKEAMDKERQAMAKANSQNPEDISDDDVLLHMRARGMRDNLANSAELHKKVKASDKKMLKKTPVVQKKARRDLKEHNKHSFCHHYILIFQRNKGTLQLQRSFI